MEQCLTKRCRWILPLIFRRSKSKVWMLVHNNSSSFFCDTFTLFENWPNAKLVGQEWVMPTDTSAFTGLNRHGLGWTHVNQDLDLQCVTLGSIFNVLVVLVAQVSEMWFCWKCAVVFCFLTLNYLCTAVYFGSISFYFFFPILSAHRSDLYKRDTILVKICTFTATG